MYYWRTRVLIFNRLDGACYYCVGPQAGVVIALEVSCCCHLLRFVFNLTFSEKQGSQERTFSFFLTAPSSCNLVRRTCDIVNAYVSLDFPTFFTTREVEADG